MTTKSSVVRSTRRDLTVSLEDFRVVATVKEYALTVMLDER